MGVTDVLEKDDVNLMLAIKTQGEVGGPGWQHLRTEKVEAQDLIIKQKTEELRKMLDSQFWRDFHIVVGA